jgi:hypothetical protein
LRLDRELHSRAARFHPFSLVIETSVPSVPSNIINSFTRNPTLLSNIQLRIRNHHTSLTVLPLSNPADGHLIPPTPRHSLEIILPARDARKTKATHPPANKAIDLYLKMKTRLKTENVPTALDQYTDLGNGGVKSRVRQSLANDA